MQGSGGLEAENGGENPALLNDDTMREATPMWDTVLF